MNQTGDVMESGGGAVSALARRFAQGADVRLWLIRAAGTLIVAAVFVLPWLSLGDHPLYSPDEGRYARTSQLMTESGDLLVPRFENHPRLEKPPVVYWLQGAAMTVLGDNELAARLPSALFTTLALGLTFWFGYKLRDAATGAIAVTIMGMMPLAVMVGRLAIIDPILNFFWLGATFAGYLAMTTDTSPFARGLAQERRGGWVWAFWIMTAAAVFTKGPVGLLPVLVLLVWAFLSGRRKQIKWRRWAAGLVFAVMPLIAWAIIVAANHPEAWTLWRHETLARAEGTGDHLRPIYYYLPFFLAGFFPATALLPLPHWHMNGRRIIEAFRTGHPLAYLAVAITVPLMVFSLMAGKLGTYILPLAAPTALIAAWGLRSWLQIKEDHESLARASARGVGRRLPDGMISIAVVLTAAWSGVMLMLHIPALLALTKFEPGTADTLARITPPLVFVPVLAWIAVILWRKAATRVWALLVLAATLTAMWGWILGVDEDRLTIPAGDPAMLAVVHQHPPPPSHVTAGNPPGEHVGERDFPQHALGTFGYTDPSLSFYADRYVPRLSGETTTFQEQLAQSQQPWIVFADPQDWRKFAQEAPALAGRFQRLLVWNQTRAKVWVMVEKKE